jgi:hypothetical protein
MPADRSAAAAVLLALACAAALLAPSAAPAGAGSAALTARGSTGQAYVLDAPPRARLELLDRRGRVVASGGADRLGSRVFRDVAPGPGYRVRRAAAGGARASRPFRVLRPGEDPPRSFFRRTRLQQGLNYVAVRDGIELAMTVRLPPGRTLADGPFPTLVEYSGYQVAAPGDLLGSLAASLSGRAAPADPLLPATATLVGAVVAPLLDFAVVSVQMRGSGCSGGAFDLFDLPTTFDGYDAVETVAAQPWVKGGKVGMAGISFSGITQLFTAGTRPPHLAAIAPMSVTDDTYSATGFPGGIRNSGFARSWLRDRVRDARPAPAGGQPYARALVRAGDRRCRANQRLRLQSVDALALSEDEPYRDPALFEPRAPATWMERIDVPTFLVGQFHDEQTGAHFAESLGRLRRNEKVWVTLQNGVHVDSLGPDVMTRWVEFLKLYVAEEVPVVPPSVLGLSAELYRFLAGSQAAPVQQSRFAGTTDVAAARAAFERDPRVRVLMDNGAGPQGPGSIGAAWELGFAAWPPPQARPATLFLGAGGTLAPVPPRRAGTASYTPDPRARPATTLPGTGEADAWRAQPPYDWRPVAAGRGAGFLSAPLERDLVIAGSSSLDLRLRSTARDTDLQVTLSEVRPDGQETYVQSGWLRASHRALDPRRSTVLRPVPTHREEDAAPLPAGRYTRVRVPILPVAHAFRAGSRLRVTVQAPGGDRPRWRFATLERGRGRTTIALGGMRASRLVLPEVPGVTAQTPLPAPTALRGQPSRAYRPASNGG